MVHGQMNFSVFLETESFVMDSFVELKNRSFLCVRN